LKGLRYEKLEIKELRLSFEDPRRGRHSHPHHHHGHEHEHEHDERGPVRRLGEEIEEIGRRIADSVSRDDDDDDHRHHK